MKADVDYANCSRIGVLTLSSVALTFIDYLYNLYERNRRLYTAVFGRNSVAILADVVRNNLNEDQSFIEAVVDKINILNEERRIIDSVAV